MDFVNEVSTRAKEIATVVKDKTSDFVETSKLKLDCVSINKSIEKKFQEIGELVYRLEKTGEQNDEAVAKLIDDIDRLSNELDEINDKISERKGVLTCPACSYS
ncbi:MAG: hypothetical protein IJC83_04725, partial [Oscillospiraceae bacterium]|nr:hypothetical protein [Oscillospiraceae bacterium]